MLETLLIYMLPRASFTLQLPDQGPSNYSRNLIYPNMLLLIYTVWELKAMASIFSLLWANSRLHTQQLKPTISSINGTSALTTTVSTCLPLLWPSTFLLCVSMKLIDLLIFGLHISSQRKVWGVMHTFLSSWHLSLLNTHVKYLCVDALLLCMKM